MIIALVIPKNKRTKEYPSNTEEHPLFFRIEGVILFI